MIIHIVMWKLKSQPADATQTQPPATFTDATATGVIQETQEQINAFKENSKREIAEALSKVPGPLSPMQFGAPLLPERSKGYEYALYSRFKDLKHLQDYAVSEAHVSVVNKVVKPRTEESLAYDIEVPDDA
ncbi:hypothetical protein RSOLAG1IB_01170 [Rhizoctonia solani AG-1 IB]|uniref:Stress-response A/B barrel domain-containing protein n=1 Tax=Thanatephorus cucumeris (strain AG1-IB / isolate 7/3/14) TaxID=1108050 RepID=A0A0B7FG37_THACB|nr:hypothetical protein RSOLAG1IB_01170 [Rhizoctonia solani AG-1 IB]